MLGYTADSCFSFSFFFFPKSRCAGRGALNIPQLSGRRFSVTCSPAAAAESPRRGDVIDAKISPRRNGTECTRARPHPLNYSDGVFAGNGGTEVDSAAFSGTRRELKGFISVPAKTARVRRPLTSHAVVIRRECAYAFSVYSFPQQRKAVAMEREKERERNKKKSRLLGFSGFPPFFESVRNRARGKSGLERDNT